MASHSESQFKNKACSYYYISVQSYFQLCFSLATFCSDAYRINHEHTEWKQDSTFQKLQHQATPTTFLYCLLHHWSASKDISVTSNETEVSKTKFFREAFQAKLMESAATPRHAKPQKPNSGKLLFQWDIWGIEKLHKEIQ